MREMIAPQSSLDANPKAKLLPLEKLISNPFQVRQDFDSPEALAALEELAADISGHGVLQPILVKPSKLAGKFEIVAGERRYRAAQIASISQIPAIVENFNDEQARLVSLTENLQRRNLTFKEEVEFLARLNEQRSLEGLGGEAGLAKLIHKSRTYIAKRLKLASFPELIERVSNNEISINQPMVKRLS
jgi:ParB family chromosome partitioning protein